MTVVFAVPQARSATPQIQNPSAAVAIAARAVRCLLLELETWPKPGLVSHIDSGSHHDMDAGTFRRSAAAIAPYFHALAEAGAQACAMGRLRIIGLEAEAAMRAATCGINTHRGAIFGLGLLCAAAGARAVDTLPDQPLGRIVARRWGAAIAAAQPVTRSHGAAMQARHGAGGARHEAASGFPNVARVGLPALQSARRGGHAEAAARVHCLFALIATVGDTNLLHRGGAVGAAWARRQARGFLARGGVSQAGWENDAISLHQAFVARRLSPGGCADLLAMTLLVDALDPGR